MKSILLATAASVAFAGAAAAEVTFSGEASASYNNLTGYSNAASLTASMSQALDNGYTATASVTLDYENTGNTDNASGSISIASDTASLTFGTGLNGAAYSAVSDTYAVGAGEEATDGIVASYKAGDATVYASLPVATGATANLGDVELGVVANVSGMTVSAAFANNEFAGKLSGSAAGATFALGASNSGGTNQYDASVSYPVGPVTLSASIDENQDWEVGGSYAADGMTVGATYAKGGAYEVTGSYAADAMSAQFSYDGTDFNVAGTYTAAAITVEAGRHGGDFYAQAGYDLGGGATLSASYAQAGTAENIAGDVVADGATVKVAFAF